MSKLKKSLKRNSKNIFIFIIVTGFTACGWIFEDTSISPEKPPLFRLGDTLIFESEVSFDSFYVNMARLYKVGEDDGTGKEWDNERYFSEIIQIDCSDSCYKFKSLIMPEEYYVGTSRLGYKSNVSSLYMDRGYAGNASRGAVDDVLIIGKHKIKGFLGYTTTFDSLISKGINTFLYSKKYGLVQYQLYNNEVFQITEESLEMLMARE